ncbi:MAG: hypothetical protein H6709_13715 [Kofleriaceae bacterium]|nr:hypothetical protein [Kofleriaceae bacterium]MCB9573136.1 hypothetical protein [Kofleriaceae bacterium]
MSRTPRLWSAALVAGLAAVAACVVVPARPASVTFHDEGAPGAPDLTAFRAIGDGCPAEARLIGVDEAEANRDALCGLLEQWDIARLDGGGSMAGPGYGCEVRARDDRSLGHGMCVR